MPFMMVGEHDIRTVFGVIPPFREFSAATVHGGEDNESSCFAAFLGVRTPESRRLVMISTRGVVELYTSKDKSSGFTRWDLIYRSLASY
jgi:hypothetical protein